MVFAVETSLEWLDWNSYLPCTIRYGTEYGVPPAYLAAEPAHCSYIILSCLSAVDTSLAGEIFRAALLSWKLSSSYLLFASKLEK